MKATIIKLLKECITTATACVLLSFVHMLTDAFKRLADKFTKTRKTTTRRKKKVETDE